MADQSVNQSARPIIVVYQAKDGLWGYAPESVRHWLLFNIEGEFKNASQALSAVERDDTCRGMTVRVECPKANPVQS
jgi:hypothetical protein